MGGEERERKMVDVPSKLTLTFDIQGVGGRTMRIFCDAYCPRTVLCVHSQHLSAGRSGLTLLCGGHDRRRGGIFDVYS